MLTQSELKAVLTTLTQRRAWLRKTLEDSKLDADVRKENTENLHALESAMQKLAALPSSQKKSGKADPAGKAVKRVVPRNKKLSLETMKVLVADDQATTTEMISQILADLGVTRVQLATDGREAFDQIRRAEEPFDIILCDWEMPELDGLQVLEKAKASNTLGHALFWMVTGVTDTEKIREAAKKGVRDYIAKPLQPEIIANKLKAAVDLINETALS